MSAWVIQLQIKHTPSAYEEGQSKPHYNATTHTSCPLLVHVCVCACLPHTLVHTNPVSLSFLCPPLALTLVLSVQLLELGGVANPASRVKIICPEHHTKFPEHFSLGRLCYYSARSIKQITQASALGKEEGARTESSVCVCLGETEIQAGKIVELTKGVSTHHSYVLSASSFRLLSPIPSIQCLPNSGDQRKGGVPSAK